MVAALFRASTLFIIVGLLPGIVSNITDRSPRKTYYRIVSGFNIAGLMPFVVELWNAGNTITAVKTMAMNANVWLAIYGSAAIGWGLIMFLPPLIMLIMSGSSQVRSNELQEAQNKLIAEWGDELKKFG